MKLKYKSDCSGIEAASVAWEPLGWEAVSFSEIDAFPSAVLAHHYSDVPNVGDFTKDDWSKYKKLDVIIAGTPCQDYSVAGKREGADGARGNLTIQYAEKLNESQIEFKAFVWENVPGVLSDRGNAFGRFLGLLAGEETPLVVPRGKWPNAGYVLGPRRAICWRVLDAQYFGLAQRRKRVFLVACPGDGLDPRKILFEWDGLRRDTPPGRGTKEDLAGTLTSRFGRNGGAANDDVNCGRCIVSEVAPTIPARKSGGGGLGSDFDFDGGLVIAPPLTCKPYAVGRNNGLETCIAFTQNTDVYAIQERAVAEKLSSGPGGKGFQAELAYTLEARSKVQAVSLRGRDGGGTAELSGDLCPALQSADGGGNKPHVLAKSAVRRLTPRECERLQGFPDDYTLIPRTDHLAGLPLPYLRKCFRKYVVRTHRQGIPHLTFEDTMALAADSPRYKALGNSMAVPVIRWIGERIETAIKQAHEGREGEG